MSWFAMSELETGNTEHAVAQLVDLTRYPGALTKEFLFDYRNAVGTMLMEYLIKKTRPALFDKVSAAKALDSVKEWRWHEFTGEVMFAYSLLIEKDASAESEIRELVKASKKGVEDAFSDKPNHIEEMSEVGWKLLTLNSLDEHAGTEMFTWLAGRFGAFEEALDSMQIDTLSALLWTLSLYGKRTPGNLADELTPKIAEKLLGQIREVQDVSIDPELTTRLVTALQLAKDGLLGQARQESGLVMDLEGDRLVLDISSLNVGLPRISLLSKAKISLTKAGFYHPFMISSNELELYKQILTAEVHGSKFVRKYELGVGLAAGGLTLSALVGYLGGAFNLAGWIQWGLVALAAGSYSDVAWGIWKEGAITKDSASLVLRRLLGYLSPSG